VKRYNDFGRTENTFNVDGGINGNEMDASVGYEHYNLWLSDHSLDQAQHARDNFHAEVGSIVPGLQPLRAFVRYGDTRDRLDHAPDRDTQARTISNEQILNDANGNKGAVGCEAKNEKAEGRVEFGYENGKPISGSGLSGDTREFSGVLTRVQAA